MMAGKEETRNRAKEEAPLGQVSEERGMEALPVEVIGIILSFVASAREVVAASATCRKWRVAACHHLRNLSFNSADWYAYRDDDTEDIEFLITDTILQTTSLERLSFRFDTEDEFSAAAVIAWLHHTRGSLRFLTFMMKTKLPTKSVLERCAKMRLEGLVLGSTRIFAENLAVVRYPSLLSLTLSKVKASARALNFLLSACPKLELFALLSVEITSRVGQSILKLSSLSLKAFVLVECHDPLRKFVLNADNLQSLHLKDSSLLYFGLVSKNNLLKLKLENVHVVELDIGKDKIFHSVPEW